MGIMSACLNGTDVLDHCMFAEALLIVVRTMSAGACLQKRCFAVYVHRGMGENGVKVVFVAVLVKFHSQLSPQTF